MGQKNDLWKIAESKKKFNGKRIYLAGPYSANNIIQVLTNIHDGMRVATALLKQGYSVFTPWLDHQFHFYDRSLTITEYYNYSMAWLEVADALWVLPHSENSKGTQDEIIHAQELGILVKMLTEEDVNKILNA